MLLPHFFFSVQCQDAFYQGDQPRLWLVCAPGTKIGSQWAAGTLRLRIVPAPPLFSLHVMLLCSPSAFHLLASFLSSLQFNEAHNKVLMAVIDTMCDFIVIYKDDIPPNWLRDVIPSLLTKFGAALVPKTQEKILYALELVRNSFPVDTQLINLVKLVLDPLHNHNLKVKLAIMEFTALVLPLASANDLDTVVASSPSEFRGALTKMLDFANGTLLDWQWRLGFLSIAHLPLSYGIPPDSLPLPFFFPSQSLLSHPFFLLTFICSLVSPSLLHFLDLLLSPARSLLLPSLPHSLTPSCFCCCRHCTSLLQNPRAWSYAAWPCTSL